MHTIKRKNTPSTFSRALIAGSCSAMLLLGAAGAIAEHHESSEQKATAEAKAKVAEAKESVAEANEVVDNTDGAVMSEEKAAEARTKIAEAEEDVSAAQKKVAETDSGMATDQKATEQAAEGVAEAEDSIAEAKENVAEARQDVADESKDVEAAKQEVAQEREDLAKAQDQHQTAMAEKMPTVQHTANSIIGKKIKNSGGEDVGEVSDIGIDWQNAKTSFIVVSTGGVMGVGADLYKVPMEKLSVAPDADYFTMDTTEKDLKSEFSKFEPVDERDE